MKRIIRRNTFETNSSSTHSLSLSPVKAFDFKKPVYLNIWFDEYGWGYDVLRTPEEKLSYLFTAAQYERGWGKYDHTKDELLALIKSFRDDLQAMLYETNVYLQEIDEYVFMDDYCPMGYIDHQSVGECECSDDVYRYATSSTENLMNYLFNELVEVIIDNDNHE